MKKMIIMEDNGKKYKVPEDLISMVSEAEAGLYAGIIDNIANTCGLSRDVVAESYFDLSYKTVSRYVRSEKVLNPRDSETALKILMICRKGAEVFGSTPSFNTWCSQPAFGIDGRVPFDLFSTNSGLDLVLGELRRMEFGDLS